MSSWTRPISILAGFFLLMGCLALPLWSATGGNTLQIIIKFGDTTIDPTDPDFVQSLSREAAKPLTYVRPMSGGAHVYRVEGLSGPDELAEVVSRLSERTDVIYVEQDRILQHQPGRAR